MWIKVEDLCVYNAHQDEVTIINKSAIIALAISVIFISLIYIFIDCTYKSFHVLLYIFI